MCPELLSRKVKRSFVPTGFGINWRPCGFELIFDNNTPTRCSSMTQPPPKPPRPGERGPTDPPGSTINYARPAYFAPSRRVTPANHHLSNRSEPVAVSSQEPVNQSGMEPRAWLMSHGFNPNGDLTQQIASHRYFWIVSSVSLRMYVIELWRLISYHTS